MQQHAEDAVTEHMADLQRRFFKEKKNSPNAPYSSTLDAKTRETLVNNAIRQSERRRVAKANGKSDEEILAEFNTPFEMTVFTMTGLSTL